MQYRGNHGNTSLNEKSAISRFDDSGRYETLASPAGQAESVVVHNSAENSGLEMKKAETILTTKKYRNLYKVLHPLIHYDNGKQTDTY